MAQIGTDLRGAGERWEAALGGRGFHGRLIVRFVTFRAGRGWRRWPLLCIVRQRMSDGGQGPQRVSPLPRGQIDHEDEDDSDGGIYPWGCLDPLTR
jgi:hypothetical protein